MAKQLKKRKFICIRECIWHNPDFPTPRRLLPNGGKTIYELFEDAPRHLFKPVDPDPVPEPQAGGVVAELGDKSRKELEKIATEYGVPEPGKAQNKDALVEAILIAAGYKVQPEDQQPLSDNLPADDNPKPDTEGEGSTEKKADG